MVVSQSSIFRRFCNSEKRKSSRVKQAYANKRRAVAVKFQVKALSAALKYRREAIDLVRDSWAEVKKHGKELAKEDLLVIHGLEDLKSAVHLKKTYQWEGEVHLYLNESESDQSKAERKAIRTFVKHNITYVIHKNE